MKGLQRSVERGNEWAARRPLLDALAGIPIAVLGGLYLASRFFEHPSATVVAASCLSVYVLAVAVMFANRARRAAAAGNDDEDGRPRPGHPG